MAYENISDKRRNCLKRAISPFATMFAIFSHNVIHLVIEIFFFLTKYIQRRLLQNCHMRERVKVSIVIASMLENLRCVVDVVILGSKVV